MAHHVSGMTSSAAESTNLGQVGDEEDEIARIGRRVHDSPRDDQ